MYKLLKKISKILFIFILIMYYGIVKAVSVPVENIFNDITPDYPYYYELQTLYDKGMFFPDDDGEFKPNKLLERDEYVGIALEVNCNRCIIPNTEMRFIEKYKIPPFFDVQKTNKYFYCISHAKASKYVAGYNYNVKCDDGTYKKGEKPFCNKNTITREEALAVILRMGNILTAEDAEKIRENIRKGIKYPDLALDIKPILDDGKVYSFYPDFKKALEYKISDIDVNGSVRVLKLMEKKGDNFFPNDSISKEDFLKMAYVALKGNNGCLDLVDNNIALEMEVFDKECSENKLSTCDLSDMEDPDDTFDLNAHPKGFCDKGIDNPKGYTWRFYHEKTREHFIIKGKYIENHKFEKSGKRIVYLRVIDNCGNTAEVHNYFYIKDSDLTADIEVFDKSCQEGKNCDEIKLIPDPENPLDIFDLNGHPKGFCKKGINNPDGYKWIITHKKSGEIIKRKGKYIENFEFKKNGLRNIGLEITDNCGNIAESDTYFRKSPGSLGVEIKVHDKECIYSNPCDDIDTPIISDTPNNPDDPGDIFDLEGYPIGVCEKGIDNPDGYKWTITHKKSGEIIKRKGKYIENFEFKKNGLRIIGLEITDNCGKVAESDTYYRKKRDGPLDYFLKISIDANPIIGPGPLEVDLRGIVDGSNPDFSYRWNFRDGTKGEGEIIKHIFMEEGVYEVELIVTDDIGKTGTATVLIMVTSDIDCDSDIDGDGINDCIDKCPLVKGSPYNSGCSIFDEHCNPDCSCGEGYVCGDGNPKTCSTNICKPKPIKLSMCLDSYKKRFTGITFGNAVCQTCPCENNRFLDFVTALRFCDTIFPAITSPDEKKIYKRGNLFQIK